MEAELETMLVETWIKGDRAKLLLQEETFARRLVEIKEEHERVVNELSLRATRQEKLRQICAKRVQDLEHEVALLREQLSVSANKLRETENLLRRERMNHNILRRRCSKRFRKEGAPTPADQVRQRVLPSFGLNPCADCDGHDCEGSDPTATGGRRREGAGELVVVRRLVERLLEDNFRLESIVRQMEGETRGTGTEGVCKKAEPTAEVTGVDTNQPEDAEVTRGESLRGRRPQSEGVRQGSNEAETDCNKVDRNMALFKIQALTGMVLAQEEIETLLCQELELKNKQAGDGERMWRLLARWSQVLENRGYATEKDIRSAGLLEEMQLRFSTDTPRLLVQGLH